MRRPQRQRRRYALATAPLAVADYTYDTLPAAVREAVPSSEQLGTAVAAALNAPALNAPASLSAGLTVADGAAALNAPAGLTAADRTDDGQQPDSGDAS